MSNNASFLPEDYLDQKAEQRTNLISLVLFAVVMLGVFLAFLFTNEKRSEVKQDQEVINARYQEAAEQIPDFPVVVNDQNVSRIFCRLHDHRA